MANATILIIDDHALFRSGVVAMLSTAFDAVAVIDVASVDEALVKATVDPTIVLLDLQLSGKSGLDGIGLLRRRWPRARVIVVSAHDRPDIVTAALDNGAIAFLSKADRPEQMMAVLSNLLDHTSSAGAPHIALTPRQREVLELVGRGLSNKMIGRALGLSEHTVRGHVQALLATLGVARRTEAVFEARRAKLIQ